MCLERFGEEDFSYSAFVDSDYYPAFLEFHFSVPFLSSWLIDLAGTHQYPEFVFMQKLFKKSKHSSADSLTSLFLIDFYKPNVRNLRPQVLQSKISDHLPCSFSNQKLFPWYLSFANFLV